MLAPDRLEMVFIPADPPRLGRLALWSPGAAAPPHAPSRGVIEALELVTLTGSAQAQPRRRRVQARLLDVTAALAMFTEPTTPQVALETPSARAWSTAMLAGLGLVARGRLLPALTPSGHGAWRAGPLDDADHAWLRALVAALPATAYAVPVPGSQPVRLLDPVDLVRACWDAIADTLVRPGAVEFGGPAHFSAPSHDPSHDPSHKTGEVPATTAALAAFAAPTPLPVPGPTDWLTESARAEQVGARVVLRIEPPADHPDQRDHPDQGGHLDQGDHGDHGDHGALGQRGPDQSGAFHAALALRSVADPSLLIDVSELWAAPAAVLARLGHEAETDLLLGLRRGSRAWPPLSPVLDAAAPAALPLSDAALEELFGAGAQALQGAGIEVLWPAEIFADTLRLRASARSAPAPPGAAAGFTMSQLLEFSWRPALSGSNGDGDAGEPLTDAEIDSLTEAKRPVVRLRGRWVRADPALLERLRRRQRRPLRAIDALAAALSGTLDIDGEQVEFGVEGGLGDLAAQLRAAAGLGTGAAAGGADAGTHTDNTDNTVAAPEGLHAQLRPYQLRGLAWLALMTSTGLGGCLADDMGLGKTIQVIALHLHRRPLSAGPTLVVCPTSLLGNWARELARFAPDVPVRRFHGGGRHLTDLEPDAVVLVTYGVVRRDRAALAAAGWGLVVADEAQHAKNPHSRTARELRAIPSAARVALSGTPVENRLSELWALLDWTTPGLLGPLESFRRGLAVPVERYRDPVATDRLARIVRPFLLRRRKSDPGIAPELPAKTETDRIVPLTTEQATLYAAVVAETLDTIAGAQGIARRGLVLALLTALKQICNHPAQYLHEPGPLPGRSGKLAALDELLEVILAEGESVLVFSQYVEMNRLIQTHLTARGVPSLFLHGGISPARRELLVAGFQAGEAPVFLLSLKAGGVGLNLTRATHVIHFDRWWNPAVEAQATDRAYRIGQDRPVQVHRFVTEGTVEDRIAELLAAKQDLADAVVGSGEAWLTELDDAALADLVSLGGAAGEPR